MVRNLNVEKIGRKVNRACKGYNALDEHFEGDKLAETGAVFLE